MRSPRLSRSRPSLPRVRAASERATPRPATSAPAQGGGFLVLEAYPYPKLPSSPDLSGIFASNAPLNEYMKNYPLFTLKSMSENAYQQPADHACEASMISKTYTSTSDARTEFSSKVSVAAEFWGVSGSASAAYEQASETMRSGNSTYTAATIMCGIHAYELVGRGLGGGAAHGGSSGHAPGPRGPERQPARGAPRRSAPLARAL